MSVWPSSLASAADVPDQAIHKELRGMISGLNQAINARQYDQLGPFFHPRMRVTTIDQEFLASREERALYFNKWFGSGGYLKSLLMSQDADVETELYGDKSFGIARGKGMEHYELADGRKFDRQNTTQNCLTPGRSANRKTAADQRQM